jgi:protein MpaA
MEEEFTCVSLRCRLCSAFVTALALAAPATGAAASERLVIGHSVEGRPIVSVGSGTDDPALKVLVVGSIHGNETAGVRIARQLIATGAPAKVELTVVPTLNPDGVAAGTRGNAHGVDLNRNFPFRWRPLTSGEYSGPGPLSEPESRAAQRLVLSERPDVTIWFHQPFGLIDRPKGNPFAARLFSELIRLPLRRLPGRYPGSVSRWQNHRFPGATAFVAELPQRVNSALVKRGAAAVRTLAAELASAAVDAGHAAG